MWMAVFETKVTPQCKSLANMQIDLPACSLWTTELFSVYNKPMNICSNPQFANLMEIQTIIQLTFRFTFESFLLLKWRDWQYYHEVCIQCISQGRFTRFNYSQVINTFVKKLSWHWLNSVYVPMVRSTPCDICRTAKTQLHVQLFPLHVD